HGARETVPANCFIWISCSGDQHRTVRGCNANARRGGSLAVTPPVRRRRWRTVPRPDRSAALGPGPERDRAAPGLAGRAVVGGGHGDLDGSAHRAKVAIAALGAA